ncbi:MAG: flagellar basal body-associated FliL family protein [Gammaproteobacteria bacterium]|nr:flagellar basal body-associated FliL family protein [Gammaproteobacteria bacterium]
MPDKQDTQAPPASGGSKKNIVITAIGAIVLIAASAGATFFLVAGKDTEVAQSQTPAAEPAEPRGDPRYLNLDPPFTVNLEGSSSLLSISISILVYGYDVEKVVAEHMPQIRSSLVLLFSNQDAASVKDRSGKDKLRASTLETIRGIVSQYTDNDDMEVFFTGFVMQ